MACGTKARSEDHQVRNRCFGRLDPNRCTAGAGNGRCYGIAATRILTGSWALPHDDRDVLTLTRSY